MHHTLPATPACNMLFILSAISLHNGMKLWAKYWFGEGIITKYEMKEKHTWQVNYVRCSVLIASISCIMFVRINSLGKQKYE